jgi:hypothetical protein
LFSPRPINITIHPYPEHQASWIASRLVLQSYASLHFFNWLLRRCCHKSIMPFALFLFCRRHGALRCRDEITDAPSEYDVPWDPAHSHPLLQLRPVHLNLSETLSTLSNAFPFHVFRHHFPTVYRSHQRRCSATINAKRQSYMWLAISCMLRCLAISAPRQPGNQTSTVYHFFLRLCRRLGMLPVPSDNRTKRSSGPFSTCFCQRSRSAPSSACPRAWSCQLIFESRGMRYRFPAYIISW